MTNILGLAINDLATAFDPTTVAGCTLYLRSDLGVTLSGSTVTAWADQSGNGRNATPVGSPTQTASVQNGYPGITFNGTNQYFTLGSSALGANWTVFIVFEATSVATAQTLYVESPGSFANYRAFRINGSKINAIDYDGTTAASASDATLTNGTCYVGIVESAAGNPIVAYTNGDAGTSVTAAVTGQTDTSFAIGIAGDIASGCFGGNMMALVAYNAALNSTDRAYVRDGLKTLYAAY